MHLTISLCTASFGTLVSNVPGVSTTWMSFPNLLARLLTQKDVTDEQNEDERKNALLRIVFPVVLLQLPVFPIRTIRTSLSIVRINFFEDISYCHDLKINRTMMIKIKYSIAINEFLFYIYYYCVQLKIENHLIF